MEMMTDSCGTVMEVDASEDAFALTVGGCAWRVSREDWTVVMDVCDAMLDWAGVERR